MSAQTTSRLAQYCVWRAPSDTSTVYLSRAAMVEIKEFAENPRRTVSGKRAEAGGLLVGSRAVVDGKAVLRVDLAEALHSEHRSGPGFELPQPEHERLKEEAGRLAASGAIIVGTFRTDMRDDVEEPHALADDWRLLDSVVPEAGLLVIVRTSAEGQATARMHVRVPGRTVEDTGWVQFPFGGTPFHVEFLPSPPGMREESRAPAKGRKLAVVHKGESVPAAGTGNRARKPASFLWPVAAGLAGAALALATAYVADRSGRLGAAAPPASMAADIVRDGLTLRWDGAAKGFEHGATLTVNDGGELRRFELDPSAARAGRMSFAAKSAETHVALDGRGIHETVVVLR